MGWMNKVFRSFFVTFVIVFSNNILVYSKREVGYVDHLCVVLWTLRNPHWYAKFSQGKFWLDSWLFLFILSISSKGIMVDSS